MLQRLADEAALLRTAYLYAQGADRRDPEIWRQIMAPDCTLEGPGFTMNGIDQWLGVPAMLGETYRATAHRVSQQIATIKGDEASGETYCAAEHLLKDEDAILVWSIRYQDRWRRDPEGWRFIRRALNVDWQETRAIKTLGEPQ